jgi:biopolymer transport protein ExbD
LITFFMFTTTFTQPNMMKLSMPDSQGPTAPVSTKNSITFILGKENTLYWHQSDLNELSKANLYETDYGTNGIRKEILEKITRATKPENFTVVIKPTSEATYKNTVDILDEMHIMNIQRYALVNLFPSEEKAYEQMSEARIKKNK